MKRLLALLFFLLPVTVSAQSRTEIPIRKGEHETYSRLVLDFVSVPDFRLSREGDELRLLVTGDFALDVSAFASDPLARIRDARLIEGDGTTELHLTLAPGSEERHFLSGSSLVIDALGPTGATAAGAQSLAAAESEKARVQEPDREQTATHPSDADTAPQGAETTKQSAGVPVALLREGDATELRYGWRVPTTAAVFARAGWLWVVFERGLALDHRQIDAAIASNQAGPIEAAMVHADPDHSIMRYRLKRPVSVAVRRDGREWRIRLSDIALAPARVLEPERRETREGTVLHVPSEQPGGRIRVTDPEVGDGLDILPLGDDGRGLQKSRRYVDFELLESAQGLVIRSDSDALRIVRFATGIEIGTAGGLRLSKPALSNGSDRPAAGLIDLLSWSRGPHETFVESEQALLVRLSRATPAERKEARWALARFYLANHHAPEGLAMLKLLEATDPEIAATPQWRAAAGVAALALGRDAEALALLLDQQMDTETDIWLWRALAAEGAGRAQDALTYYRRGAEALVLHEAPFLARFHLAMTRAALAEDKSDIAAGQIASLRAMELNTRDGLETEYLAGVLAERHGDIATARLGYEKASKSQDRALEVRARLALLKLNRREGDISLDEAIKGLERLRFAWRGDRLELDILETLAMSYRDAGRHRLALETLRMATSAFAGTADARRLASEMSKIFADLFLNGAADKLPPIEALGLFYDFSELTPLGAEGDRMIRRLVERLVAVDLLDRAAGLLEHQVTYRLEGMAQADVAAQLGKIYLLDGRPEEALRVLRMTRNTGLPGDVIASRNLVEARALAEIGRNEEAEVLIEDDESREAEELRADIHWKTQDWRALSASTERLLGTRWQSPEPLGLEERDLLIRQALALSFLDDRDGLARLGTRYAPLMREGDYAAIFNLLTGAEPLPRGELPRLLGEVAGVERFRSFLAAYRAEFAAKSAADAVGGS